jgi:hypothetical protein
VKILISQKQEVVIGMGVSLHNSLNDNIISNTATQMGSISFHHRLPNAPNPGIIWELLL